MRQVRYKGFNGVSLVADVFGDDANPNVLFAHGGGQTRHAWRRSGKLLAEAGFQSICLDLRGHGESSWCPQGDYRIEAFAEDLACVCAQLGSPPVLVGASLGGVSAMVAAGELQPGLFSSIVLVDVTPHMEMSGVEKILGFMTEHVEDGFASIEDAAEAISAYLPHRPKPQNLNGLAKNLNLGDDGRYRWRWDPRFITGESRPSASRDPQRLADAIVAIDVPMMLVRGKMSELVSEQSVRQFLELKPDARVVDVANARHMVAGDSNDAFTAAITEFLLDV
ncbi:MAG: alpha/beta hydrolase [Pseudomonadales bacterium]|jgi:pimeloyl-ACP methyl ester carboxylesterase